MNQDLAQVTLATPRFFNNLYLKVLNIMQNGERGGVWNKIINVGNNSKLKVSTSPLHLVKGARQLFPLFMTNIITIRVLQM